MRFRREPPAPLTADWIIAGIGNPGPEYRGTRHNIGFDLIEALSDGLGVKLKKSKHHSLYAPAEIGGVSVLLVKPLTYVNLSGQSLAGWSKELNVKPAHILVISDDIHLAPGILRLREKGSSGGHNGLKSIASSLHTEEYPRLRVGVGEPTGDQVNYVLGRFSPTDRERIDDAVKTAVKAISELVTQNMTTAQVTAADHNQLLKGTFEESD